MDDPQECSICHQPLHRLKHPVAHEGVTSWSAEIRTCPHNLHHADHFGEARHDEWHRYAEVWIRRES